MRMFTTTCYLVAAMILGFGYPEHFRFLVPSFGSYSVGITWIIFILIGSLATIAFDVAFLMVLQQLQRYLKEVKGRVDAEKQKQLMAEYLSGGGGQASPPGVQASQGGDGVVVTGMKKDGNEYEELSEVDLKKGKFVV